PDGTWDGYDTILGCRQALVINDEIASTVELENTNGAQTTDIPRTCVGIKPDGTVVVFAMESMYYYDHIYHQAKEGDPHGMSLPEIAEFAYYYGCNQAANFDGGGSTQLITRAEDEEKARVLVRSADTSSYELLKTRVVVNSLMVTSKVV
ncbi:MAG: phosphodiester glycosidase family protein, partial [Clostridia bacterium]|nr:phosphodiester glycosidase family protein [Clostridia bacterium]